MTAKPGPIRGDLSDAIDSQPPQTDHEPMTLPSREEYDAKLATMEARMDGQVSAIQASIDGFIGRMDERWLRMEERFKRVDERMDERDARFEERFKRIDERFERVDERFERVDDHFERLEAKSDETQEQIRNLKSTMIVTALSTAVAIVLGVAAFNATVLSNMLAAFDSGRETAAAQAQVLSLAERVSTIEQKLDKKAEQQSALPSQKQ